MKQSPLLPRRRFLKDGALLAGGLLSASFLPACGPSGSVPQAAVDDSQESAAPPPEASREKPSNRINLAFVGLGLEGFGKNLPVFLQQTDTQIIAVCDVDQERRERSAALVERAYASNTRSGAWKGCEQIADWGEAVAREDVDAVVVATPDHWHALVSLGAVMAGKHVFCEKPLTHNIHEGRVLSDAVQRHGVTFLTASEARSRPQFHRACELVRNKRIGDLREIQISIYAGHGQEERVLTPRGTPMPVPEGLDYEMWLGPAPDAAYMPERCHISWRYMYDYGGGNLADWGSHLFSIAQWANDTEHTGPVRVWGEGRFPAEGIYDVATDFDLNYAYANGVNMRVQAGGLSIRFEGSTGWIEADFSQINASDPEVLLSPVADLETWIHLEPRSEHRNFLDAAKTGIPTYAPAETGHRTATLAHLGNIVLRLGREVQWDPATETVVNDPAANRLVHPPMRRPWILPV